MVMLCPYFPSSCGLASGYASLIVLIHHLTRLSTFDVFAVNLTPSDPRSTISIDFGHFGCDSACDIKSFLAFWCLRRNDMIVLGLY